MELFIDHIHIKEWEQRGMEMLLKSLFNGAASRIHTHIAGRGQQGISYNTKSVNIVEEPFVEEDTMEEHTVISKLLLL